MKQLISYAGTRFVESSLLSRLSRLHAPGRAPLAVAAVALLLLVGALAVQASGTHVLAHLVGEPKPVAILALGIVGNGLAGFALHRRRP